MPELPEVESIVRSLDKKISGKKIYRISVLRKNILQLSQKKFSTILLQQKIQRVFRYGKYIIFELENLYLWVVHLRMSGKFIYPAQKKPALHDRVLFELNDKTLLSYNDVRCFGTMELLEKDWYFLKLKNWLNFIQSWVVKTKMEVEKGKIVPAHWLRENLAFSTSLYSCGQLIGIALIMQVFFVCGFLFQMTQSKLCQVIRNSFYR